MELISRDEVMRLVESGKLLSGSFGERAKDIINSLPTIEEIVTVRYKQNEGLYLETDEDTLLEAEYIVMSTDGMYKEYVHETE